GLILSFIQKGNATVEPDWHTPPVICGYNEAQAKEDALVLVGMKPLHSDGKSVIFGEELPLVVHRNHSAGSVIACLTDLAPHWSGGLTDWGSSRIKLSTGAEVG